MANIYLVRTDEKVIKKGYVGLGWGKVDFSQFQNIRDLLHRIKEQYPNGIGKSKNKIKYFFSLKAGDIVVIPLVKSVAIGIVEGKKNFDVSFGYKATNLVSVSFFRDKNTDKLIKVPRAKLTDNFQRYLKFRGSICNLKEFEAEIQNLINDISNGDVYTYDTYLIREEEKLEERFKKDLLQKIVSGKSYLSPDKFEMLIIELLKLEGYTAIRKAKNQSSDISDIDIKAYGRDIFSNNLFIQAKLHEGETDSRGVKQLLEYQCSDDELEMNYKKCLVTTAILSESAALLAEDNNILVIEGIQLVDWIYKHVANLSMATKNSLGIMHVPVIV